MEKSKKLYLVWQDDEDSQYYNQYDSLDEAVLSEDCNDGEGVEIFEADLTLLGTYTSVFKSVKVNKKGKK